MRYQDVAIAFNERYGTDKTACAIRSVIRKNKIACGRTGNDKLFNQPRLLTEEQDRFVRDRYVKHSRAEVTNLLNTRFGTTFTVEQIVSYVKNNHITCGRTGQFEKGNIPWTAGTKGVVKPNSGSFRKGNVPKNLRSMQSKRFDNTGGVLVKVPLSNPYTGADTRYLHEHVYVWTQANGAVPDGMVIIHKDGNSQNNELSNLVLVNRAELLRLNKNGYRCMPDEVKPTVMALSKMEVSLFARMKEK